MFTPKLYPDNKETKALTTVTVWLTRFDGYGGLPLRVQEKGEDYAHRK